MQRYNKSKERQSDSDTLTYLLSAACCLFVALLMPKRISEYEKRLSEYFYFAFSDLFMAIIYKKTLSLWCKP